MPKSKKRQQRSRKHRGTQSGRIDTRGRTGRQQRPRSRQEAKATSKQRRQNRFEREPTLRAAVGRAGLAAGFFIVLVVFFLKEPPLPSIMLGVLAFAVYVPLGHYMDKFMYRRYQRRKAAQKVSGESK